MQTLIRISILNVCTYVHDNGVLITDAMDDRVLVLSSIRRQTSRDFELHKSEWMPDRHRPWREVPVPIGRTRTNMCKADGHLVIFFFDQVSAPNDLPYVPNLRARWAA